MKITVAIDSLKGSLTSMEAGNAAKDGILRVCPEADPLRRTAKMSQQYLSHSLETHGILPK